MSSSNKQTWELAHKSKGQGEMTSRRPASQETKHNSLALRFLPHSEILFAFQCMCGDQEAHMCIVSNRLHIT